MSNVPHSATRGSFTKGLVVFGVMLLATFALVLLLASILQHRSEAAQAPQLLVPMSEDETDPAKWGENFPQQYDGWKATAEMGEETKYGGPRHFSWLERNPQLKELFAGYPFAVEYNEERGHAHALEDVTGTARIDPSRGGKPQPGTCMTCKSPEVPVLMNKMGIAEFYSTPFEEIKQKVQHPIGCSDCHDPLTMNLRITRPALREAFAAMGRDIDQATAQELRSLVCAQCHVEYYFAKKDPAAEKGTYLTFPWQNGTTIEDIEKYYQQDVKHVDWVHPVSKTEMIKMQHPDYEIYLTGVHAYRNVSCADCHMPYLSEGGVKYTDHHIQSPLKNISNTCGVCHRWSEAEVKSRVESIQDKTWEVMLRAQDALVAAHSEIGAALAAGATDQQLAPARDLVRRAQMRWDFISANNGMGFHSPQESVRVLATALDLAQLARLEVAKLPPAAK